MPPKKQTKKATTTAAKETAAQKRAATMAAKKTAAETKAAQEKVVNPEVAQPVVQKEAPKEVPVVPAAAPAQQQAPKTQEVKPVETSTEQNAPSTLINLDKPVSVAKPAEETKEKKLEDLTPQELKQLRMQRFGGPKGAQTGSGAATTLDALAAVEEQKRIKQERAERFGIVTKEMTAQKLKERAERFGIITKEQIKAKKEERLKRFGQMDQAAEAGVSTDELAAQRKARMERFGITESEAAANTRSVIQTKKGSENVKSDRANRRKAKLARKLALKKNKQQPSQQLKGRQVLNVSEGRNQGLKNLGSQGRRDRKFAKKHRGQSRDDSQQRQGSERNSKKFEGKRRFRKDRRQVEGGKRFKKN